MTLVRIGRTVWQTGAPRFTPLTPPRNSTVALWGRAAAVLALTGTLAATTLVSTPKADQSMDAAAVEDALPKDGGRVEPWLPPASAEATHTERPADETLATGSLLTGIPTAQPSRFGSHAEPIAAVSHFEPWTPAAAPVEWREQEFTQVSIIDGRTLEAGAVRIRLVGLDLPLPEQVCRTLDGRFEPCASRAATQLELLTRHRKITCHYRVERAGEAIGRCRLGMSDLSERLVQTGYVWRSSVPSEAVH